MKIPRINFTFFSVISLLFFSYCLDANDEETMGRYAFSDLGVELELIEMNSEDKTDRLPLFTLYVWTEFKCDSECSCAFRMDLIIGEGDRSLEIPIGLWFPTGRAASRPIQIDEGTLKSGILRFRISAIETTAEGIFEFPITELLQKQEINRRS